MKALSSLLKTVMLSFCFAALFVGESAADRADVDGEFVPPGIGAFVLTPGTMAATQWSYTTTPPSADWPKPRFDASKWRIGKTGFWGGGAGRRDQPRTAWPEDCPDLWLRTSFVVNAEAIPEVVFWGRWDDSIELYINGVQAVAEAGWTAGYRYLGLRPEARTALLPGQTNIVAAHVKDSGGGRYFDIGIVRQPAMTKRPYTGFERTPELVVFGNAVLRYMIEHGIPSGSLAVMKKDRIVVARGFGWMDKTFNTALPHDAVFRLASNDKVLTLSAVRMMIDTGMTDPLSGKRITETTCVFPLFEAHGILPPPGKSMPPSLRWITVKHLLEHRGGVQELPSAEQFYRELGIEPGASTMADNIRWLCGQPPNFSPGTESRYSSSGYMLLRYLVHIVTGDLLTYLREEMFAPVGSSDIFIAHERLSGRSPREPWYATLETPYDRWIYLENYTALSASAEALVRFLRRYHLGFGNLLVDPVSGGYLATPDNGGGVFAGGMAGTATYILQRRWDETSIAILFNIGGDYGELINTLGELCDTIPSNRWGLNNVDRVRE